MNKTLNAPLVRTVRIACPIDHAFEVFTAKIDLWWPPGHRRFRESQLSLEAKEGGRFLERNSAGEEVIFGEVVRCEPPHRLTYTWHPGAITGPTLVDIRFICDGDHTLVEVIHAEGESGMGEAWSERVGRFDRAWDEVLPAFARKATEG